MRVLRSLDRKISWLMAEKSFQRKFVGGIASQLGVVPVSRAMDIAKAADGKIYLPNPVNNPKYLKGIGTNFTSPDFEVGGSIYLPLINGESHKFDIAKIIGPEEILIRNAPESSDALFQLTGSRIAGYENAAEFMGSQFKVAPYVNQTQVYEAVFEKLRANGCVGIFPEGASHDRTELLPLKGG
jgi:glycerol-3-phosphate O-acyltransferase/dihydroxyacetone phosphate acyltransferase